jgi:hypothetical protein
MVNFEVKDTSWTVTPAEYNNLFTAEVYFYQIISLIPIFNHNNLYDYLFSIHLN